MNRLVLATSVLTTLLIVNLSCNSDSASSTAPAETSEAASTSAENPLDLKTLITDDNIDRYMIYQREINTVADLAMGAAGQAFSKSGGDQKGFEKALSQDERTKQIADAQASALAKSGLLQAQATEIGKIIATYTPRATMGTDEMKQTAREEFKAQYGPEVLAVLEKRLPELSQLQDEILKAAFGRNKKK